VRTLSVNLVHVTVHRDIGLSICTVGTQGIGLVATDECLGGVLQSPEVGNHASTQHVGQFDRRHGYAGVPLGKYRDALETGRLDVVTLQETANPKQSWSVTFYQPSGKQPESVP